MTTEGTPRRIRMSRTKGWRKPPGAIYVGRPSRWGNPFRVGDPHPVFGWPLNAHECVALYRACVEPNALLLRAMDDSPRGHDLACWCALNAPCHADVLLELANA
jgi:hypothetical protein